MGQKMIRNDKSVGQLTVEREFQTFSNVTSRAPVVYQVKTASS